MGNAPSVGIVGGTAASSEVLGAEELEIYGYVGKETAKFKNGATARDIAVAVHSVESKTGVSASTHARLTLPLMTQLMRLLSFLLIYME